MCFHESNSEFIKLKFDFDIKGTFIHSLHINECSECVDFLLVLSLKDSEFKPFDFEIVDQIKEKFKCVLLGPLKSCQVISFAAVSLGRCSNKLLK